MSFKITNRATGTVFVAAQGETVLDAAKRQGVHLSHSCLNGTCASCRAHVLEGHWDYPRLPPQALNDDERAEGLALLCQAVPSTDLTLVAREVSALRDIVTRITPARVATLSFPVADVARVTLQLPNKLDYLAGQHLEVLLPGGKRRPFSIANAPANDHRLEMHIRRVAGGGFTDYVFSQMTPGALLRLEAPLGTFFLRERSLRPIVCVAGGTGFSPIKAIIEQTLINRSTRPIAFYWGAGTAADLYDYELARAWHRDHPHIRFTAVLSNDSSMPRRGLVHRAVVEDYPDLSPFDVYMSGPPALIEAGRREFAVHGLPDRHLYYDSFEFAPDILAIKLARDAVP